MGISRGAIRLIMRELAPLPVDRRRQMVTFGVQSVDARYADIERMAREENVTLSSINPDESRCDSVTADGRRIHQHTLFRLLGFTTIDSIDVFPDEQPTFQFDLNERIPAHMHGRYDLVYDGGTTEHCFNVPQVLENVLLLLGEGGMIIHHSPSNNWYNHGFYQLSPTLYQDYYGANGCHSIRCIAHMKSADRELLMPFTASLPPVLGTTDQVYTFFSAVKGNHPPTITMPIQGFYLDKFGERSERAVTPPRRVGLMRGILRHLARWRICNAIHSHLVNLRIVLKAKRLRR